jgi:hypothetical protein
VRECEKERQRGVCILSKRAKVTKSVGKKMKQIGKGKELTGAGGVDAHLL